MSKINILIVVDVQGALSSNSLIDNVYLVDTNQFIGSWHEGSNDLHTVVVDGQVLQWRVVPVSSSSSVSIASFSGQMISDRICIPSKQGIGGDEVWQGQVESRGSAGSWPYAVSLSMDGKTETFTSVLKVV